MQNFTLGKKGISMLLFGLVLLIGSSPSFGQTCPTADPEQFFCDAGQPTIADLEATGENISWYDTATSNTVLLSTQILADGETYYASNPGCVERVPVTVTVYSGPEILGIYDTDNRMQEQATKQSLALIGVCVPDPENPNLFISDLRTDYDDVEGVTVNWYYSRTSNEPIADTEQLRNNTDYYAGLTVNNPTGTATSCDTNRTRTTVRLYSEEAPTGDEEQFFCSSEEPTLADIVASGTNRYFTTATSITELASSTTLVNGTTYFVSSVGEFCESEERLPVTVTVQDPQNLGTPEIGIICEADVQETFPSIDEIRKYYLALLPEGVPTNGTFDPTPAQLAQNYQNDEDGLGDFTTTYTVGIGECVSEILLTATIVPLEDATAGTIGDITVACDATEVVILDDSLLSQGATPGGTFTGEGINEDGNFDPAVGPGDYTITYTVDDSSFCVVEGTEDFTNFTITVEGLEELPDTIAMEMCITEVQAMFSDLSQAEAFFNNILAENGITNFDGSFDPSENVVGNEILDYINSNPTAPETFNTTYTVTSSCGEESVDFTLMINNTEEPNAGEINAAPVCSSATPFDLYSLLGDNNDQGGTFTTVDGEIADGLFDVSVSDSYLITYTVTASAENCTAGDDDFTEFTLTVNEGIVAESPEAVIVCESDVQTLFPSVDEIRKYYIAIAQRAGFPTNGTISPTGTQLAAIYQADEDGLGDFTTTYTFGDGACQTSVELTVTIIPVEDANAGTIEDVSVDCDNEEVIVLASLPNEGGSADGIFSGESVTNGNFDPSVGPGTYTITYSVDDTATCVTPGTSDETTFTITVLSSFDLGAPIVMEMCITEVQAMVVNPQLAIDLFNDAVAERTDGDLSGEFTPSIETIAGQIGAFLIDPTPSKTFETTYSVSTKCGDDSVLISLTINNTVAPSAGEITPSPVCVSTTLFDLNSLLGDNNDKGGNFSTEDGQIADGLFDVSVSDSYLITYTVTASAENCTEGDDSSTTFTLMVNESIVAESPAPAIVCESDVQALFPSNDEIRKFYTAIAQQAGFPTNGTFNPTPAQLATIYQNDEDGLGDFTTTYTITSGDCVTTVELTARIVAEAEATTGTIADLEVCLAEGNINLYDRLTAGNTPGGTFSTEDGVLENGLLDVSEERVLTVTYTVSEDDAATCLTGTASTEFTVTVSETTFDAGAANSIEVCNSDVRNLSETGVRNLYLGLLDDGISTNGTFEPTISQLITQYNFVSNYGDFTTTYTLGEGDCADSAVLTVTVIEANDAGADMGLTFCATEGPVNLLDFLSPYATTNGTFEGLTDGMFDPSSATIGETVIIYEVEDDESICSTSNFTATFTINVVAPAPANAGGDQTVSYCLDQDEDIQLTTLLGSEALMTGSFRAPFANGVFNPSTAGIGEYVITYTVDGEDDCAIDADSATITITVNTVPDAPVAESTQSFCLVNNNTVADLVASGDNIVWYEDEDLTTVAPATTPLENGAIYYAVATGDNTCVSPSTMVTVIMNDPNAPTLQLEGNEFCRSDNPTLQDLLDNISGSGIQIYASLTGGIPLASTTELQNDVQYFATATDATLGCESSERLAIRVEVAFCGIPEGFSPNGDDKNDSFVIPEIAANYPNYTIEIYNRWGNQVFKGNASTPDWDGLSNQSGTLGDGVLPVGVYFYILNYNDGATASEQGKLYLSR